MAVEETHLSTGLGEIVLSRQSRSRSRKEQNLRPWDAADELLLAYLAEQVPTPGKRFLIVNDQYGALTVSIAKALPENPVYSAGDSYLSQQAMRKNLAVNNCDEESINWLTSLDRMEGEVDYLLIKLPKSLALLEDQLHRYRQACKPETRVIAAGMVKYMPAGVFRLFEGILGPTHTSLAKKKARLIFSKPQSSDKTTVTPGLVSYRLENTTFRSITMPMCFHANHWISVRVFCWKIYLISKRYLVKLVQAKSISPIWVAAMASLA